MKFSHLQYLTKRRKWPRWSKCGPLRIRVEPSDEMLALEKKMDEQQQRLAEIERELKPIHVWKMTKRRRLKAQQRMKDRRADAIRKVWNKGEHPMTFREHENRLKCLRKQRDRQRTPLTGWQRLILE